MGKQAEAQNLVREAHKRKMTRAQVARFRERIKDDPVRHADFLQKRRASYQKNPEAYERMK